MTVLAVGGLLVAAITLLRAGTGTPRDVARRKARSQPAVINAGRVPDPGPSSDPTPGSGPDRRRHGKR
jgi:hypothetical protein